MAAVTVQDCLKVIPNRFELTLIASHRAKQLMNGSSPLYVSEKVEKNTVVALREIAANLLNIEKVKEEIKSNIKSQALFKNFDESATYDVKREIEVESASSGNVIEEVEDEIEDDVDIAEDDEEYYDEIADEDTDEDLSEDIEK